MAARKLQQEVDKCFKKVAEGVAEFEAIYDKIEQSNNPAQKEKQEDNLKREIKKLQRLRDQIKSWAASNDIKDKAPLLDHRRLIETQMEKFKAVEKAMKTKAYSKEGLSAAARLDPKEQAKVECGEFLSTSVDELEQQIEALEAESESLSATMKKGKAGAAKAERIAEIERIIERHKWHQGKLELIRRTLENGGVETEQVMELEESIKFYLSDGMTDGNADDEGMYDELDLEDDEGVFGLNVDNERSSQDAQSTPDDAPPEPEPLKVAAKKTAKEPDAPTARKTTTHASTKSPLPALATLHTPLATISGTNGSAPAMKPAQVPARPAGEGLKYASAAAAAAAAASSDKSGMGIAPLPPPPGATPVLSAASLHSKTSAANSPASTSAQLANVTPAPPLAEVEGGPSRPRRSRTAAGKQAAAAQEADAGKPSTPQPNGTTTNGIKRIEEVPEEESVYHLPPSLQDLVESFEATKRRRAHPASQSTLQMMASSRANYPDGADAECPRTYRPEVAFPGAAAAGYPREPLAIFDDPRLYSRIDTDTLFYVFYYKQGTPHQYLAAKALKDQSWRFHKQYQTWFQRHEEPKSITDEFEQGTYRFFDYESTWMNRRKAEFRFVYKFLEDDV
ncbi:CCR4-NOT transcription complex subunit 3 [Geosmithia morbida]|uniref:General negative regulator of transcription subunit n=1 Tax=Geosmithia morbida TaxID=1094350 RepID=A0A9P4YQT7_9HYPO|nr:CCR4-NOT transcription complex subunit 3 [Geosmithia morbida]KAF4120013.1 CCR4-NOT transcription complex subunit 3 [Geosmithia morbida]